MKERASMREMSLRVCATMDLGGWRLFVEFFV